MSEDNKKTINTVEIAPIRVSHRVKPHKGLVTKAGPGRPPGSLNRITKSLKEAVVAAADELGRVDRDKWAEEIAKGDENGVKRYFKILAVEEMRTFGIILARIMPLHINTNVAQKYLTEEQMRTRLREAGLSEGLIEYMRPVDARKLDPEEISRPNPYSDPEDETDDEGLVDVTPNQEAAE